LVAASVFASSDFVAVTADTPLTRSITWVVVWLSTTVATSLR
jgi:hypothetical protein